MKVFQRAGEGNLGLFTDLYELTMCRAYLETGMTDEATFTLFVRRLPENRNYLLACGIADTLRCLESLRFHSDEIDYLASLGHFPDHFLDWLRGFRFTGTVRALPEGTPFFYDEPIVEVTAPIAEAQLVETLVMNQVHLQTVIASKASRVVQAAEGRPVIDFGARRIHGTDAAVKAAHAFHVAGCAATSNVLGGFLYGVPVAGTMAHSFIQAAESEMEAFRTFARLYPDTILLVDSYDTLRGVKHVIELAKEVEDFRVRGIRLDSGDLAGLAKESRRMLDEAGLRDLKIVISSSLDEYAVTDILAQKAPVDGFGVGTKMGVSADAPYLDMAYKLSEYAGKGRLKLSSGKPILPGRKQIFRQEADGRPVKDIIAREGEDCPGRPLLVPVMRDGKILEEAADALDTEAARARVASELAQLAGSGLLGLETAREPYRVEVSDRLKTYQAEVGRAITKLELQD